MNQFDHIPVINESELAEFGFSGKFIRKSRDKIGGYEWHGPCPNGCGEKQLIISNGLFWCRVCSYSGNLSRVSGKTLTDKQRKYINAAQKSREEYAKQKKINNIKRLTNSQVWEIFHRNLLRSPEHISLLENDGIPLRAIQHFKIGFNPSFKFKIEGKTKFASAITFPILRGNWCLNVRHRILLPEEELCQGGKYRPIYTNLGLSYLIADFPDCDFVVIVEGEKKAIVLWTYGIPALAFWGVHSYYPKWIPEIKSKYDRIYVLFDGDNDQVIQATNVLAKQLGGKALNLGGKPDDLIVSGQLTAEDIIAILAQVDKPPW